MKTEEATATVLEDGAGMGPLGSHALLDEFALAYHRAVTNRLRAEPSAVLEYARRNLDPWAANRAVIEQIGFASSFQEMHGYYADVVGLATVVLPTGWQERLVPLADEARNLRAYCLEVHDAHVSKLMAGKGEDFTVIKSFWIVVW